MVFGKLKNYASNKFNEVKENRKRNSEINKRVKSFEREEYFHELEKKKTARALEHAREKAETKSQPRIQRVGRTARKVVRHMPTINKNGPDPFGLFSQTSPTKSTRKQSANRNIFVLQNGKPTRRVKKRSDSGFSKNDYLDNLM